MNSPREHIRVIISRPARLRFKNGSQFVRLIDLSETGSRIEVSAPLSVTEVTLEWSAVAGLKALQIPARVLWQKRCIVGLHFSALSERDQFVLKALIRHQLNED